MFSSPTIASQIILLESAQVTWDATSMLFCLRHVIEGLAAAAR